MRYSFADLLVQGKVTGVIRSQNPEFSPPDNKRK